MELGQRFNKLVVQELVSRKKGKKTLRRAIVKCDCGQTKELSVYVLLRGQKSCGCEQRARKGHRNDYAYPIWEAMRDRCRRSPSYRVAGIRVVWETFEDFKNYIEKELGPKPTPEHSIDRVNNAGNYEPGNIRWATAEEQARNRSDNRLITVDETTLTTAEWAEQSNLSPQALYQRLKRGWSKEDAVGRPKRHSGIITAFGETKTVTKWAEEAGITTDAIFMRLKKGWTEEEAISKTKSKNIVVNGESKTVVEWSKITGVPATAIYQRLDRGWEPERAIKEPVKEPNK